MNISYFLRDNHIFYHINSFDKERTMFATLIVSSLVLGLFCLALKGYSKSSTKKCVSKTGCSSCKSSENSDPA